MTRTKNTQNNTKHIEHQYETDIQNFFFFKLAIINKSTTRNEFAKISSYSIHSQVQTVKVRTFNRSTRANQLHA